MKTLTVICAVFLMAACAGQYQTSGGGISGSAGASSGYLPNNIIYSGSS